MQHAPEDDGEMESTRKKEKDDQGVKDQKKNGQDAA
jgi:hypothetical protein